MPVTAPPPTAPAPKSSPAPASPAPSAPSPHLSGGGAPSPKESSALDDAFADLDALDQGKPEPSRKKEAAKESPPSKGTTASGADEEGKEDSSESQTNSETQSAKDAKESSKGEQPEQKPVKAKELREAYEGLKKRVKEELEPEVTKLRTRVKELESKPPEDVEQTNARVAELSKRNSELEEHIQFVDFQKSKEYQDKYWQPYVKAWETARRELKGLQVEFEDKETGETKQRDITDADLQYLAGLEPVQRRQEINRLFPNDKEEVKRHINEITRLADESDKALATARKASGERLRTAQEQRTAAQKKQVEMWQTTNRSLEEKFPLWYKPTEGDQEGNAALDKATAMATLVYAPNDLTPQQIDLLPKAFADTLKAGKPLSPEQRTQLHAIAYQKLRSHDRMALRLKQANALNAELRKELDEYENSSPDGKPESRREKGKGNWMDDANAELDALDRKDLR